jgi:hypothetical protein
MAWLAFLRWQITQTRDHIPLLPMPTIRSLQLIRPTLPLVDFHSTDSVCSHSTSATNVSDLLAARLSLIYFNLLVVVQNFGGCNNLSAHGLSCRRLQSLQHVNFLLLAAQIVRICTTTVQLFFFFFSFTTAAANLKNEFHAGNKFSLQQNNLVQPVASVRT